MKKFDFKLGTVLKVREQELSEARHMLMEAELVQRTIEEKIVAIQLEYSVTEEEQRQRGQKSLQATEIRGVLAYLHRLQVMVASAQDDLLRARNVTGLRRREVAEAQQQKKMIENLKAKEYREWQKEMSDAERKFLDEIATQRYAREMGGGVDEQ